MSCGIYKIVNNISGKIYIGQSINVELRWKHHKNYYNYEYKKNHLYSAFKKYGIDNFTFSIICEVPENVLDVYEISYINYYDSTNPKNGYNKTLGGKTNIIFSEDSIQKMSYIKKGRKLSSKACENIRKSKLGKLNPMFGKITSDYTKQLLRESNNKPITYNGITYCSRIEMAKQLNVSIRTVYRMIEKEK